MAKARKQEPSTNEAPKGLWDKGVDWIVSKLSCFSSKVQDDIGEELDDIGDAVIAPAVTIASDALEGLARTHLPGAFGELVATAIDDLEGEAVAFLGGTPSLEIAEA